ncbi:hypothetical protein [Nocardiopsis sp. Huas11]|uniref:hypothetical protein n=1 Tax=Nocardiopsis sp. Huas11 TaxID=2183912 RepID=UPI000EB14EFA|nr:hypothetical protein [Nocardiopsis sp. Huas11]
MFSSDSSTELTWGFGERALRADAPDRTASVGRTARVGPLVLDSALFSSTSWSLVPRLRLFVRRVDVSQPLRLREIHFGAKERRIFDDFLEWRVSAECAGDDIGRSAAK